MECEIDCRDSEHEESGSDTDRCAERTLVERRKKQRR
jgi:hypothetical protein